MFKRILVPVDGSEPSQRGLRQAIDVALSDHATLVILNVVDDGAWLADAAGYVSYGELSEITQKAGQQIVEKAAAVALEAGVACETLVVAGTSPVSDAIVDQAVAQRCDLIAMGTHGRRGLKRLTLGSDAELVVRRTAVPVLLAKGAGDGENNLTKRHL